MTRRIKVMFMVGSMETGGTERHILEVIRNIDRTRFDPVLCCISSGGALEPEFRATGVRIGVFGFRGIRKRPKMVWDLLAILWFILKERPDVVHAYLYWANIVGGLFGYLTRRPVIITSRRGMGTYKDKDPRFQKLEDFVNRFTHVVTVNSLGVKTDVLARERVKEDCIRLIYNGVHLRFGQSNPAQVERVREELELRPTAKIIGCVANVRWYKGYGDLVEAFAAVKSEFPDTQLVCVGKDGGIIDELRQRAAALSCDQDVVFTGLRHDVERILPIFDIQVLASHEEGFSNAVLEGMASGNPMVVTSVGGNAEAVLDGIHGYVVPPQSPSELADAILALMRNPVKARQMGLMGQERVRSLFTVHGMVSQLERLYIEQLAQNRPTWTSWVQPDSSKPTS